MKVAKAVLWTAFVLVMLMTTFSMVFFTSDGMAIMGLGVCTVFLQLIVITNQEEARDERKD